jgi:predicted Holliday junction resolvase-like endonuclease
MLLRIVTVFLMLITLSLSSSDIRALLVIKATKSTIEAEDLVQTLQEEGISSQIYKIKEYQLVVVNLPLEEPKATPIIVSIKKEYPEAFKLYLPIPENQRQKIDIQKIADSFEQKESVMVGGFDYLEAIPKKDLPIWGALILLLLILFVLLIKSYLQRRQIGKLQDKLSMRQKEIEQSISQEKKTIQERKQLQRGEK